MLQKIINAKKLLLAASQEYSSIAIGNSLGKDSIVVAHLALELKLPHFTLLSDTEFDETYLFLREVEKEFDIAIREYRYSNAGAECCCSNQKVATAKEATAGLDAWVSGIRNTEGITRTEFKEREERDGLVKINPILSWTETDVWRYLAIFSCPVHPIYAKGYRSLGCAQCSTPAIEGEDERAGRWRGDEREECGIHTESLR